MNTTDSLFNFDARFEDRVYWKVTRRIIPILLLAFVCAYLDRVNVGFAKLTMQSDLGHSDAVYGLGAGVFFIGYFLFEVPSNLLLQKFGARLWLGRIMISWGLVSGATAFVSNEWQFYLLRFLLGVAEAGFFPGVILYLTYWYPAQRRGHVTSIFMSGVAIAGLIGGPISGWILDAFEGYQGFRGWQWIYLLEAIPSVLMGVALFVFLEDRIATATWLTSDEKAFLEAKIREDRYSKKLTSAWGFLRSPRIWQMTLINFFLVMGLYGISFWMPTFISHLPGIRDHTEIGLLSALPWGVAITAMIFSARHADRYRERRWHLAIPASIGALGMVLSVCFLDSFYLTLIAVVIATAGVQTSLPMFWALPTAVLAEASAPGAIAMINSIANLSGFISPSLIGWIIDSTGNAHLGMFFLAFCLMSAASLTLMIPRQVLGQ